MLFKIPHNVAAELESPPIAAAADILRRLPPFSTPLPDHVMSAVGVKQGHPPVNYYLATEHLETTGQGCVPWACYKVTTLFDINTVRLALLVVFLDRTTHILAFQTVQGYVNLLSRLFDLASTRCGPSGPHGSPPRHAHRVVQAFLWTARQRSLLLFSYYVFGTKLRREINTGWLQSLPRPVCSRCGVHETVPSSPVGQGFVPRCRGTTQR